jgi:glutamyl-tRNA reductase
MHVGVISINHEKAPVEIREKVAFTDKLKIEAMDQLLDLSIDETMVVSTCNRSEVYVSTVHIDEALKKAKNFLSQFFEIDLEPYIMVKKEEEAIRHIYRVAAGLDSLVIGEDQILGQVKEALEFSMEIGSSKKILNKVVREAITFSKKMKETYRISEHPLSLGYIGVKFMKEQVKDLKARNILIVGTGEMGSLVLKYLIDEGAQHIFISNRSESRCKIDEMDKLYDHQAIQWVKYEERYKVIQEMDVVFCATSSPHTIFKKEIFQESQKEQWFLDMAIPRDIDERIGTLEFVNLYNIDDLKHISEQNWATREQIASMMNEHIEKEIVQLNEWIHNTKLDPIIESLQELSEEVAQDTLDMIHKKMTLNHRETEYLNKLIRASLKRMVRTPIQALKSLKEVDEIEAYKEMLHKLYDF